MIIRLEREKEGEKGEKKNTNEQKGTEEGERVFFFPKEGNTTY